MMEIYMNDDLKYPLTELEYNDLDNVWEFIDNFKFLTYSLHDYRSRLIKCIKNKYKCNEFLNLEFIVEKLFWNLRNKTNKYFDNIQTFKEGNYNDMISSMYRDNSYRSFINKLILIDDINYKCYYKKQEGSSEIFSKNKFNLYTSVVLFNRNLYENIMKLPENIKNIYIPKYYYEYDYGFPNLNFCKPFIQTKNFRILKINKMYYDHNPENNWFKLIKYKKLKNKLI